MANKWVYLFSEGNANMRELLGGKGANLAEMTGLGLPVPQGFTITTEACTPVSYTHLDVYKRQGYIINVIRKSTVRIANVNSYSYNGII